MKNNKERGGALVIIIVGTLVFFAVLGAVLWYVFSFAPAERQLAAREAREAAEAASPDADVTAPLAGTMTICNTVGGDALVRYYLHGPRIRYVEISSEVGNISLWDGEVLARYQEQGSKKWFRVAEKDVPDFHAQIESAKKDTAGGLFTCEEKPFDALFFKRQGDPIAQEKQEQ